MVAGTVAAEVRLEFKAMETPLLGAGPLRVTVPVELLPPATDVGLSDRPVSAMGATVRVAV